MVYSVLDFDSLDDELLAICVGMEAFRGVEMPEAQHCFSILQLSPGEEPGRPGGRNPVPVNPASLRAGAG